VARRVLRIQFDRLLEQAAGFGIVLVTNQVQLLQAAQDIIICDEALRRLAFRQLGTGRFHPSSHRCHDRAHDLVLDREDVFQFTVIRLRPQMSTSRRIDELCSDANSIARPAYAALHYELHAQPLSDFSDVNPLTTKGEGRIASDYEERAKSGQFCDDVLDNPIAEILLFWNSAHVYEGQDGD
jgi:hypothetical protein